MSSNEDKKGLDPDYASNNIAISRVEKLKEESSTNIETLKEILNEQFNKDLSHRQNEIEQIEREILKSQKLLHMLRYVLISSYYNKKELEYNCSEEPVDSGHLFDQNRIHPALKKLLGKNSTPDILCRSTRRIKTDQKPNLMVESLNDTSFKNVNNTNNKTTQPNKNNSQHTSELDTNRQKIKNRIIVGNISKWMPSYEDDNLTHKWMMYIRGPKENPDVSHFIEKVVFYLHPSYKPHDVVEVCEHPFHLSRRGWGEFPIRVRIYFKCTLNKPVDIVHNLKLDKTYSGRQTLGNESIIDLYLYDYKVNDLFEYKNVDKEENVLISTEPLEIKKHEIVAFTDICEKLNIKEEFEIDQNPNFEHDYCTEDVKSVEPNLEREEVIERLNIEHAYSSPYTDEFLNIEKKTNKPEIIEQENNALIHGLDDSYSETPEDIIKREPLYYRKTLIYTPKLKIETPNTKNQPVKRKTQPSLLKKLFTDKINSQLMKQQETNITDNNTVDDDDGKATILLPRRKDANLSNFASMGEALQFLFKRFPIISDPKLQKFRFSAESLKEYLSWNIGKQTSAEWSRAKIIRNIITRENIKDHHKWNTKTIMMYGRSHGYTPTPNYNLFEKNKSDVNLITNCFGSYNEIPYNPTAYKIDLHVDIVNESDSTNPKRLKISTIDISDTSLDSRCSFIREEALECGVVLKNEFLEENVVFNGAERMIYEALNCFLNHLVRRSLHHGVSEGSYRECIGKIKEKHVKKALFERKQFEALKKFKIKQKNMKYFYQ